MSQENVEVVRRFIQEVERTRGDLPSIVTFWDVDCDYYPIRKFPDAVPRHGREEYARFLAQFLEAWERFQWPIKRLIPVGDDRVLAFTTMGGEGPGSQITMESDVYHCVWLRHELIFRWEDHLTLKGALFALGLHGETLNDAGLEE